MKNRKISKALIEFFKNQKGDKPSCKDCGIVFDRRNCKHLNRTRCDACRRAFYKKDKCYQWKGGQKEKSCLICNTIFKFYPYREKKARFCSKKCMNRHKELNRKEPVEYHGGFNKRLKELIRNRDNRECQLCGQKEFEKSKYRISVHHINYDKQDSDINNLTCLCARCNFNVEYDKEYYTAFFKDKLLNRSQMGCYI